VWAPIGERPIAHGHHRFDWLYVTAFASPATGETFWYLSNGVSKEFFEALLETFAREAGAGLARIILLVLDNAGWHANLKIPDGIRLVYLPPYGPELQPAETLWGRCHVVESLMRVCWVLQLKSCGGDDFIPRLHGRCPEGSVRSC
jgi:hypothetical protein